MAQIDARTIAQCQLALARLRREGCTFVREVPPSLNSRSLYFRGQDSGELVVAKVLLGDQAPIALERVLRVHSALDDKRKMLFPELLGSASTPNSVLFTTFAEGVPFAALQTTVERKRSLTVRDFRDRALPLLEALRLLHDAEIIHGDLKNSGLMFQPSSEVNPTPRVLMLDITSLRRSTKQNAATFDLVDVPCAREYAAPERLQKKKGSTKKGDVYSVGVILYQALTARFPHQVDDGTPPDTEAIADAREAGAKLVPPMTLNVRVDWRLSRLLCRMLDPRPERRPSAVDSELALRNILRKLDPMQDLEPGKRSNSVSRWLIKHTLAVWVSVFTIALSAGAGWWLGWKFPSPGYQEPDPQLPATEFTVFTENFLKATRPPTGPSTGQISVEDLFLGTNGCVIALRFTEQSPAPLTPGVSLETIRDTRCNTTLEFSGVELVLRRNPEDEALYDLVFEQVDQSKRFNVCGTQLGGRSMSDGPPTQIAIPVWDQGAAESVIDDWHRLVTVSR